jgi:replicative DNA helicase
MTKNRKRLSHLSSVLNPACFYTEIGKEIYTRVMRVAKERSLIIKWQELLHDPALSEATRKHMANFRQRSIRNREELIGQVRQLHNLRKLRAVFDAVDYAQRELRKDRIDVERLIENVNEKFSEARTGGESSKWFVHIGQDDDEARKFFHGILNNNTKNSFLPTGIHAFDSKNIGIPRGSFWMLASTTSGGKSVLANQVAGDMAAQGFRVGLVQLEMTKMETGQRQIARIGRVNMSKVLDSRKRISQERRAKLERRMMDYHRKIKRNGGLLSIFVPEEDMGIEELLFTLRPMKYDIIIIDYIGLMKGADEQDYPRLLGRVARFGKRFAVINDMVVAACAQLSEENVLRYSRAMKEHAQNMWIWNYSDQRVRDAQIIAIDQPKARNQKSFTFYLKEDFARMRMLPLDDKELEKWQEEKQTGKSSNKRRTRKGNSRESTKKENRFAGEKSRRLLDDEDFIPRRRAA